MPWFLRQTLCFLSLTAYPLAAQQLPRTTPERTNFTATSTNAQVGAFLDSLQRAGAPITVSELGVSALGKPLYFVIASDPAVTSPAEAAASDRLVVYVQANIHGGEVEGKEAALVLLRELAGARHDLLDRLVILVVPDYNPDGNDALGPQAVNRSEQNGPEQVGRRPDGLNLDLNRDYFKAEAPETRASLERVYDTWDPAVMMDLHTTDGTLHGYLLTYAPPLDPVGPPGPTEYARDQMLPAIRKTLRDRYHEPIFDYGNVDDPLAPKSWDTYAPLGWYGTNYVGLRGRIGILSEAYSHADLKTRIQVTHDFVVETLEYAALHAEDIRRLDREADRLTTLEGAGQRPRPALAVAYRLAGRGEEPVLLQVMRPNPDSAHGGPPLLPTGELRSTRLPVNDRFTDSLARPLPAGYFLPPGAAPIAALLRLHGVAVSRMMEDWSDTVEILGITQLSWSPREFQGHHLLQVSGQYASGVRTLPTGSYFVSTAQPLGRLVFALLEPTGYGFARWGMIDRWLGAEFGAYSGLVYGASGVSEFPVWRAVRAPRAALRTVP